MWCYLLFFFFQAEDGIRDIGVTGVQTCALPIALPRLRTLQASVDWSHELLDGPERTLLRRLGVFHGGFTLDACEAVCADDELDRYAVLDVLTSLVDKSLVQVEESESSSRYALLETIRQYALDRLAE